MLNTSSQLIWKAIPNFEKFVINQHGDIKNTDTDRIMTFYLKISKERKNYKRYRVTLKNNGNIKNFYVHRLVAELHVPNPNNYKRIIFLDDDALNIRSDNLEWISDQEFKAIHEGNHKYSFYGNQPKSIIATHLTSSNVLEFDSLVEASEVLKTRTAYINRVIRGIQRYHKGYTFKYKEGNLS